MSTKCPSIAAAAAICGDTRWVRPPRPWRPSKLRFEVDAQRSPGARMSGFMPRHIEQPAVRQSKPAARKISSRPSCLRLRADLLGARDDHRVHGDGHLPALHDLGGGPQVADPRVRAGADEHAVELELDDRRAGLEPHVDQRALVGLRASAAGTACVTATTWPGFVPQVTSGRQRGRVDLDLAVERRAVVGVQRRASARAPRRSPRARPAVLRPTRTWCRPPRSSPRGRRPRSSCCRSSSAAPSSARGSRRPRTRRRGRRRRWCPSGRSCRGSGPSR